MSLLVFQPFFALMLRWSYSTSPSTEEAAFVADPDTMHAYEPDISVSQDIQQGCDVSSPAFETREPEDVYL